MIALQRKPDANRPLTLTPDEIPASAIATVTRPIAMRYDVVPIGIDLETDTLTVGTASDSRTASLSSDAIAELRKTSKRNNIKVIGVTLESVQRVIEAHYPIGRVLGNDAPVAWQKRFLDYVARGLERVGDDVVLDHRADHGLVSIHVDGHGRDIDHLTIDELRHVQRAALMMAQVARADDLSQPHRGRLSHRMDDGEEVDLRITSHPTYDECASMSVRIIPKKSKFARLDQLGMKPKMLRRMLEIEKLFTRLMLAAGPPSHGKSTLIRSLMFERWLRTKSPYLRSLEVPLEQRYEWLTSTDATDAGSRIDIGETVEHWLAMPTHAAFFGEIRNGASLNQVMRLALASIPTFTTTHGESGPEAVWRLFEEGANPLTLGQVLTCAVGQRLFSVLCENCSEPVPADDALAPLFIDAARRRGGEIAAAVRDANIRRPNLEKVESCRACTGGFLGRTPVFDLLVVNDAVRRAIYAKRPADEIAAADPDYEPMWIPAAELVLTGRTSPEEALRWIRLPQAGVSA